MWLGNRQAELGFFYVEIYICVKVVNMNEEWTFELFVNSGRNFTIHAFSDSERRIYLNEGNEKDNIDDKFPVVSGQCTIGSNDFPEKGFNIVY